MKVSLIDHNGSDRHVAMYFWNSTDRDEAAFTCDEEEIKRIIRFGMRHKHATPFGHPHLTVKADSIPLFVAHQWLRHRTQNFSEKSHRYTNAKAAYYVPEYADVRTQIGRPGAYTFEPMSRLEAVDTVGMMQHAYDDAEVAYRALLAQGVARELARAVLPTGLLTKLYATASLRNWFNFLALRNDEHAQLEIRRCAEQVEEIVAEWCPLSYDAWAEYGRQPL